MKHLDLFSGIGGFALAAQMVWGNDYENIAFCDNNEFCQETLRKNFPGCTIIRDVRDVTYTSWTTFTSQAKERGKHIGERGTMGYLNRTSDRTTDLLTGGFPCQPFSCAGKRKGQDDDRYLWPEMLRVIHEFQPRWVIGENVGGFVEMGLKQVHTDLENEGYEVGSFIIPACAVNAPHRRDRVWIVANRNGAGERTSASGIDEHGKAQECDNRQFARNEFSRPDTDDTNAQCAGRRTRPVNQEGQNARFDTANWTRDWREVAFATCLCGVDDGLSRRLVRLPSGRTISRARWRTEALKAYGNAIVPQVAAEIMRAIKEVETQ